MARKRKGQPVHGWILVDKPAGLGSTPVVNRLRWRLSAQKAGHGGTLDPDATGLLPVAFGHATRLLPYLEDMAKTYRFETVWGAETSTDDASGDIIATSDNRPDEAAIQAVLPQFTGDIMQVPPLVSAVKIAGERAYDLARRGEELTLAARPLHVHDLSVQDIHATGAIFTMRCGKGGYVRSMARDIGRALGTCAHVKWLRRETTCGFSTTDSHGWAALEAMDTPELTAHLLPPEAALHRVARYHLDADMAAALYNGRTLYTPPLDVPPGQPIALFDDAHLGGIGRVISATEIQPERVFMPE